MPSLSKPLLPIIAVANEFRLLVLIVLSIPDTKFISEEQKYRLPSYDFLADGIRLNGLGSSFFPAVAQNGEIVAKWLTRGLDTAIFRIIELNK